MSGQSNWYSYQADVSMTIWICQCLARACWVISWAIQLRSLGLGFSTSIVSCLKQCGTHSKSPDSCAQRLQMCRIWRLQDWWQERKQMQADASEQLLPRDSEGQIEQ